MVLITRRKVQSKSKLFSTESQQIHTKFHFFFFFFFLQLGLQQVPKIIHFPPALAEGEEGRYIMADPGQQMQMGNKASAENMARFVKERTGASILITR